VTAPREAVAIVGVGQTAYSRASGRSEWQLAIEAIANALADAEIDPGEVDGLVHYSYDNVDEAMIVRSFDLTLRYYSQSAYGGLGSPAVLAQAYAAIASGQASTVVCYRSLNGRSGTRYGRAERSLTAGAADLIATGDRAPSGAFAGPYGLVSPAQVMAMWARRYQWDVGITEDELVSALARIAVDQRAYAQRNPAAVMGNQPLDEAGYLAGRMIATPLRIFDLALETDGAAAVVVTNRAVGPHSPVWIRAAVQGLFPYSESISVYGELRNGPAYRAAGERLFRDAGVRVSDLVSASIYDATSLSVLLGLEGYGICPPGQAWRAVAEAGIGADSPLPVNTSGGHLSEAYIHGMNLVVEAVRQCRGESLNQIQRSGPVLVASGPSAVVISP
jgi:acetyl-CoA acetyltransferase